MLFFNYLFFDTLFFTLPKIQGGSSPLCPSPCYEPDLYGFLFSPPRQIVSLQSYLLNQILFVPCHPGRFLYERRSQLGFIIEILPAKYVVTVKGNDLFWSSRKTPILVILFSLYAASGVVKCFLSQMQCHRLILYLTYLTSTFPEKDRKLELLLIFLESCFVESVQFCLSLFVPHCVCILALILFHMNDLTIMNV